MPLIQLKDVYMRYDRRVILQDVNLVVHKGEFLAITGPNGGGKTTLLRLMLKLLKPSRGQVSYHDGQGHAVPRLNIGYLPQKSMIDSQFPVTVKEVVGFGLLSTHPLSAFERHEKVMSALTLCGMEALSSRPIGKLSGGQLQRALLARAIVADPEILVLDEPLSYIDRAFESKLCQMVHDFAMAGTTIILVSHTMTGISNDATCHILVEGSVKRCVSPSHHIESECKF